MKHLDFLKLPHLPNYLRFKTNDNTTFPIDELPDTEIKELYRRMATANIKRKKERLK